jgi:hypothetical protein
MTRFLYTYDNLGRAGAMDFPCDVDRPAAALGSREKTMLVRLKTPYCSLICRVLESFLGCWELRSSMDRIVY